MTLIDIINSSFKVLLRVNFLLVVSFTFHCNELIFKNVIVVCRVIHSLTIMSEELQTFYNKHIKRRYYVFGEGEVLMDSIWK